MSCKTFLWNDVDRGVCAREAAVSSADVEGAPGSWSVRKRTLAGGLRDGVEIVEVECGALRATLLPTRGMGIWKLWWGDLEIGWRAPVRGPVHPNFVPIHDPTGRGWLAGFDELLCRCGLANFGAPEWDGRGRLLWPLHGRIANLPAQELAVTVDATRGEISVRGVVDESHLFGSKLRLTSTTTFRKGSPVVQVRDEVQNLSGEAGEMQLLYHVNFGPPIVAPGSELVVAVKELAPRDAAAAARASEWERCGTAEAGRPEEVFFAELFAASDGRTRALLVAPGGSVGASLAWATDTLPCFTQWKNPQLPADGYVVGLEPGTGYPNRRSFEKARGRIVTLAPGERRAFALDLAIHPTAAEVTTARREVEQLRGSGAAIVHRRPITRFAPL